MVTAAIYLPVTQDHFLWAVVRVKNPPIPPGRTPLCVCWPTASGNPRRALGTRKSSGNCLARTNPRGSKGA